MIERLFMTLSGELPEQVQVERVNIARSSTFFWRTKELLIEPPLSSISKAWSARQSPYLPPAKETQRSFWRKRKNLTKGNMQLEFLFYNEAAFPERAQLHDQLGSEDKITKKNIRENPEYEKELIALFGANGSLSRDRR
jgi:hypothetical protein